MEKLPQPGISDKCKNTVFHCPEKQFLQGLMKFFFRNWLPSSFNNEFHYRKTLNKRILNRK